MDDAEFRRQRQRIEALLARWKPRLWLSQWTLNYVFERAGILEPSADGTAYRTLAKTDAHWAYLHATITFDVPMAGGQTDEDLENAVVHELLHVVTDEMVAPGVNPCTPDGNHVERVVSMLANILVDAYRPLPEETASDAWVREYLEEYRGVA